MADESVVLLKQQLERAKESLLSVDENIRRLTGREPGERRSAGDLRRVSVGERSSRGRGPLGQRQDAFQRLGPSPPKRPNLGSAFSRLGGRVGGGGPMRRPMRRRADSDEEDSLPHKPAVQSSVVAAPKSIRTRNDSIEEQNKDSEGKRRNRRMFGLLLGTLQQFKQDASHTTEKDKRRDKIEKKLELQANEEKEALANERKFLFLERKAKQNKLEELEQLMELAKEQDDWDTHAKNLNCFIRTKAKPHIFYKPKRASGVSDKRHAESKELIRDQTHKRRVEIEEEIKKAGADEDGEEDKEDRKRRRSSEGGRTKEGKEGDKGKPKDRRRHSEGRGKDDKNEGDEDSRGRKRNGVDRHRDDDGKERDRRDDGRKRRRSGRSREDEESREAGDDGKKESSRDSGKNRDRHRSRTSSGDRKDKEIEKDEEESDADKTKEDNKKVEEEDKEEGEVMDTDEHSSKQMDSVEDKEDGEERLESEQVGEVSSSNDNKDKDEQAKEEKQKGDAKEEKDTETTKDDQVPMEEGETQDDDDKPEADL